MIKTKLPCWNSQIKDNKKVVSDYDLIVTINTSITAEQKWEEEFKEQAKNETLFNYIARIGSSNLKTADTSLLLSAFKALYCLIECEDILNFKQFLTLFDFSEEKRFEKLINEVTNIFEIALSNSANDPKN